MPYTEELYHHGILGQKWGVRRFQNADGTLTSAGKKRVLSKERQNSKLETKSAKYSVKAANYSKKAEQEHTKKDLGEANRYTRQMTKYNKKAAKANLKSTKLEDGARKDMLDRKAAKYEFRAANAKRTSDKYTKMAGYGSSAMKYVNKANQYEFKAAKVDYKIQKNKNYVNNLKRPASNVSVNARDTGRGVVEASVNIRINK